MRESGFDNIYNLNPKRIRNRRIKVFGLMFLSTLLATAKWVTVIPTDSTVFTKIFDGVAVYSDLCLDCSFLLVQRFRLF